MRRLLVSFALAALSALALGACSETDPSGTEPEPEPYEGPPIPWEYQAFPAVVHPEDNPSSDAKIELGRLLFYDPILSADQATACATCHSEEWGLSDGLARSIGVDGEGPTGPGRTGPNMTTRNSPTLWNAAFRPELFWDGRAASLEEQALAPLREEGELDMDPDHAAELLRAIPDYAARFAEAFPDDEEPVTSANLAKALACFERTMISGRAPYDRYVGGDEGALDEQELLGMSLFAEAGCAGCHAPPLFESDTYALRFEADDDGRMKVTHEPSDRGKLRVPTLRNARETGPYFHDGRAAKLDEAVGLEVDNAVRLGESRALEADEIAAIIEFLRKGLMDRSEEPSRPDEVPSGLDVPEDGFRIPR